MFRFELIANRWDKYGERVISTVPASILADDATEAVVKGRAAFGARYDDFRKHWSHTFDLVSVTEVAAESAHSSAYGSAGAADSAC